MKFFKFIIFILSILFLSYMVVNSYENIKSNHIFSREYILIESIALSLIYALSLWFVAFAWRDILSFLSKTFIPQSFIWLWLKTNVYRYLPGNIFNYVSRQIIANNLGVPHKALLQSNIIEAVLIITVSFFLSSVILFFLYDFSVNQYFGFLSKNYIYLGLFLIAMLYIYIYKYKNISIIDYWKPLFFYLIFFIGIGIIAYYILNYQMGIEFPFLLITAIYSSAWLLGFITPGAPGGLGVRESVFVILSNGVLSEADAILLSMMLRLVSIVGEVFLYFIAMYALKQKGRAFGD